MDQHGNPTPPKATRYCLVVLLIGCIASCAHEPLPSKQRLGAIGIGVSDLAASTTFYQQVLGLKTLRTYELGYLEEVVLGFNNTPENGTNPAVLVLMHWPSDTTRRYGSGELKLVFYVDDPTAVLERIRQRGGTIDREATPHPALNGALVGLARDPDNYLIEVLQK